MTGAAPEEKSDSEDDQNIRFTIGGVGRRMTKADFIKEVQKLDSSTRKDVAEQSNASRPIKEVAKRNPGFIQPDSRPSVPQIVETRAESSESSKERRDEGSEARGRRPTQKPRSPPPPQPSDNQTETPVERRRRLAVLAEQQDRTEEANTEADTGETPAERRRREAALGMGGADSESDSEDEGGERVPPARRGIRFAEPSRR